MRSDLQKLESFLGEVFPYIKKKDTLGDLGLAFQSNAPLPPFDGGPQDYKFLQSLLPPAGQAGTLNDILKNWPEFSTCLYYDKMDVFWQQRLQDPATGKRDVHAMTRKVSEFKKDPLEESALARRILAGHVLYDLMPAGKTEKNRPFRVAADHGRGSGSPVEETLGFFNRQKANADFAIVINVAPNGWEFMPEDSLSSYLAYKRINPKMHLVASDFTGQGFYNDGVFFEGANLRFSNLCRTQWSASSSVDGMRLEGAILLGARFLTEDMLARTYIDKNTVLPKGFNRERIMEKHMALDMPPAPPFTQFEWDHANDQRIRLREKLHSSRPAPSA